jgi:hypothetical protein
MNNKAEIAEECCGMAARAVKLAFTAPNLGETVVLLRIARDWLVLARLIRPWRVATYREEPTRRWLH